MKTLHGFQAFRVIMAAALAIATFAVAWPTRADIITYIVDGVAAQQFPAATTPPSNAPWGPNGYPGDTVELQTYTGSFDLVPGITIQKVNTLLWTVNYTYGGTATDPNAWSDLDFFPNACRNMTIGSETESFTQTGLLHVTWFKDYLSFDAGSTASFYIDGYRVDVTPNAVPISEAGGSANPPWVQPPQDMMAQFTVQQVPEPAIWSLLALGIGALLGGRSLRRRWASAARTIWATRSV